MSAPDLKVALVSDGLEEYLLSPGIVLAAAAAGVGASVGGGFPRS